MERTIVCITIIIKIFIIGIIMCSMLGCKKYLEAKSDQKLVIPKTIQDAQALLDRYSIFNGNCPYLGVVGDDDYYVADTYIGNLPLEIQLSHTWQTEVYNDAIYRGLYQQVYQTNVAIATLDEISPIEQEINDYNKAYGSALFLRSFSFYHAAQLFAEPYNKATSTSKLGIPLRLTNDATVVSVRSSLEETWQQIVADLKRAAYLLPVNNPPVSRPSKAAAFALLARAYLDMDEYTLSAKYADSCLMLNSSLLDYNSITNSDNPFPGYPFNVEVLFPCFYLGPGVTGINNFRCDSLLYQSYNNDDLRKTLFFKSNGPLNGIPTYGFKGDYNGSPSSDNFSGIAVDEVFLIRAECAARLGNKDSAMADLTRLMKKRWKNTASFPSFQALTADEALVKVLVERRKELICRNTRWYDLRRLNKEAGFAKTLTRKLNGQVYTLPPNDPRYTHYYPQVVIDQTGIQQNIR